MASNENTTIFPEKYLESLDLSRELEKFKNNDDNDNDSIKEEPTEIIPDIFDYNSTPAIIYKSNEEDGNSEVSRFYTYFKIQILYFFHKDAMFFNSLPFLIFLGKI